MMNFNNLTDVLDTMSTIDVWYIADIELQDVIFAKAYKKIIVKIYKYRTDNNELLYTTTTTCDTAHKWLYDQGIQTVVQEALKLFITNYDRNK